MAEAHGDASKEVRQGRVQCGSHSVAVKTVVQLLSSLVWKMVSATNSRWRVTRSTPRAGLTGFHGFDVTAVVSRTCGADGRQLECHPGIFPRGKCC